MASGFLALTGAVVAVCIAGCIASRGSRRVRDHADSARSPRTASYTSGACPPLPLREIRIIEVSETDGRALLTVVEVSRGARLRESRVLVAGADPSVIAQLEGWCADSSVLLFFTEDDRWQLLAPDGTSTGLRVCEERA